MYKCQKRDSNEYVKAVFVNGEQHYKRKKRGANLCQQDIKVGANKKNSWRCVYTQPGIRSEPSQSFFSQRSFGVLLGENVRKK